MADETAVSGNKPTTLDKIEAGLLTREQFEYEVIDQVYAGLHRYCQIPAGYQHCELATREYDLDEMTDEDLRLLLKNPPTEIINPYESHLKAIELFELLLSGDAMVCDHGDALSPTIGAYLFGPPGSGKTHLMAAYASHIKDALDEKLGHVREMMGDVIEKAFETYNSRQVSESETHDESIGYLSLNEDESLELCKHSSERHDAMRALENARIVFIDDVHPLGDPEQIQIVLHLLERRYELGRAGTFLTTNLKTTELGGGDEMLGNRLLSRCAETLVTIDFSDCDDWRQKVKSRRVKIVEDELKRRMQAHLHRKDSLDSELLDD